MVNVNDMLYGFDAWTDEVVVIDIATGDTKAVSTIDPIAGSIIPIIVGAAPVHRLPARAR